MGKDFLKNIKKGALHQSLRIPMDKPIPSALLDKIAKAKSGDVIRNPTSVGKQVIRVTPKLERRAILAQTLRKLK